MICHHVIISKFITLFTFILLDIGNTFYWRLRCFLFYYMIRFFRLLCLYAQCYSFCNLSCVITVHCMSVLFCCLILRCVLYYAQAILPGPYFYSYLGLLEASSSIISHFLSRRNVLSGSSLLLLFLVNILPHNIFICQFHPAIAH
jgi:hypothetical protein